jgi:hypothetical protein
MTCTSLDAAGQYRIATIALHLHPVGLTQTP